MNEWIRSIGEIILNAKNQIARKKEPILSIIHLTEIGLGLNPTLFTHMLLKYFQLSASLQRNKCFNSCKMQFFVLTYKCKIPVRDTLRPTHRQDVIFNIVVKHQIKSCGYWSISEGLFIIITHIIHC